MYNHREVSVLRPCPGFHSGFGSFETVYLAASNGGRRAWTTSKGSCLDMLSCSCYYLLVSLGKMIVDVLLRLVYQQPICRESFADAYSRH